MTVAKLAQKYIVSHPSVADCLRRGIINYSALARQICDHYKIEQPDAVSVACRRYMNRAAKRASREERLISVIRSAQTKVNTKVVIARVSRQHEELINRVQREIKLRNGECTIIQGDTTVSLIVHEELMGIVCTLLRDQLQATVTDLALVRIRFGESAGTARAALAHVFQRLTETEITIHELSSCNTDSMLLISQSELASALEILHSI